MVIKRTKKDIYLESMGTMEFRDIESSTMSCFVAFLRSKKISVKLDQILDIVPIPRSGIEMRHTKFAARRLGIQLSAVGTVFDQLAESLKHGPVLVQRKSGYSFLLISLKDDTFFVGLPGHSESYCEINARTDILTDVAGAFTLDFDKGGPFFLPKSLNSKLYTISWEIGYLAKHDAVAVRNLNRELAKIRSPQFAPPPMLAFTLAAVLNSHRLMCPAQKKYFGSFRSVNLGRRCIFVNHHQLDNAMKAFLRFASNCAECPLLDPTQVAAKLFVDFLTIHPFVNGNRRMAMVVIDLFFKKHARFMDWEKISRCEIYYWVACATRGKFGPLEHGFKNALKFLDVGLEASTNEN